MYLQISIIKSPTAVQEATKTFNAQGGYIGRGANNQWVLPDPDRFLSAKHCQISSQNGQYFVTDLSTNGTFYNGSVEPLGKGNKVALKEGDVFALGEYVFQVTQCGAAANAVTPGAFDQPASHDNPFASSPFAVPADDNDLFNTPASGASFNPFSQGHVSTSDSLFNVEPEVVDPLLALDNARQGTAPSYNDFDPFAKGSSHSDGASSVNQSIAWPETRPESGSAGGAIPEDWDDDLLGTAAPPPPPPPPVTPRQAARPAPVAPGPVPVAPVQPAVDVEGLLQAAYLKIAELEKINKKFALELATFRQQKAAPVTASGPISKSDAILMEALGFADRNLPAEKIQEISQTVGEMLRDMVAGMMRILSSRSSIKNEFRMSVTTIQPVENNPLKFSATVDDALENMFLKKGNAYKGPKQSVEEGFTGIAEHQIAVLSGMRSAFKGVLERFDPLVLEKRFDKQNKGGLIPGSKNAKNWELFTEYYTDLAGDLDNSFQYLFGDDFVRAYEDQLQRLAITRSKQKN
ncbi:MAG: type VI secretion system-associated FHA domain protein TagH [Gammaproteobacteria bacterium]|nr:type VI secretion system-associated FHA domain protein TagH [Gammaproteobacteria bacterium]